jgi:hypothetical protein
MTPADPLLYILPTFAAAQGGQQGFHEVEELLERSSAHGGNVAVLQRLLTPERLSSLCECKAAGGDTYFRCARRIAAIAEHH